ncbi:MAG TPA: ABC transporter ATP-binding protein [Roseiflexaceae bacterium]|nr:ABC transporter ATP-binding protein [Roseiflexaceae bacterium]
MPDAITVAGLGKRFLRRTDRPTTLKETLLRGWRPAEWRWGLRDVSFNVAPGTMLGVVGANGAGKSTLLRLIGGVGRPDEGRVVTCGRIGALLDLGAGFHPDLSGRENVQIAGVIAGLTRAELAGRFDEIVAFAELECAIDAPLRTYSSGMQMRLAFAVAVHTDPEILLIDEVLSVGDMAFQHKCVARIDQLKAQGCAIVLVSHEVDQLRRLCDQALWLREGQCAAYGAAEAVVGQYVAAMTDETRRRTPSQAHALELPSGTRLELHHNRFGSLEVTIGAVELLDASGHTTATLSAGEALRVVITCAAPQPVEGAILGVSLSRADGQICYDTSTAAAGVALPPIDGEARVTLLIERLDLAGGDYYVDVGIYARDWAYAYDYHWHAYPLNICSGPAGKGLLCPPQQWQITVSEPQGETPALR